VRHNSNIAMYFMQFLAKKNKQKVEQMVHLAYASVRMSVANALLFLQETYDEKGDKPFAFEITREELSHLSGTTTESLIRTLSSFKQDKLIKINNSRIEIINEKQLNRIIN